MYKQTYLFFQAHTFVNTYHSKGDLLSLLSTISIMKYHTLPMLNNLSQQF